MKKTIFILLITVILFASCKCPDLQGYVKADEATYNAVAPEYKKMIEESKLSSEQKKRRLTLLETWLGRIKAAKKSLEEK